MIRTNLAPVLLVLVSSAVSANDVVLVEGPVPGPIPFTGDQPAVAPTPDGFAVLWDDVEILPSGGQARHLRFARYDASDLRVADSGWFDIDRSDNNMYVPRLIAVRGGFVELFESDGNNLWSIKLAADGSRLSPGRPVINSEELYPFSIATSGGNLVLTYPEWIGTWTAWTVPFGDDGAPQGPRANLAPATPGQNLGYRFLVDAQLAPVRGGFVSAWHESGLGIRSRELDARGVPKTPVSTVAPDGCTGLDPAVASVGDVVAVVFAAGCGSTDLYMSTRRGPGTFGPPVSVASTPQDEGSVKSNDAFRPLLAAGGDSTIGVLYTLVVPSNGGGYTVDWVFAQFDTSGRLVGPRTQLGVSLGIVSDADIDLQWDPYHHRFLLAWSGDGPTGPGVYVMGIPSGS